MLVAGHGYIAHNKPPYRDYRGRNLGMSSSTSPTVRAASEGFILFPRALNDLDGALLQGPPHPPACAVRGPQLVSEPRDCGDVEHLDQREAGQDVRVGAREVDQETQATVADDVELEEVAGPGQPVAQTQDDEEQRQVEQQLVERGGLAAHAVLH